MSSSCSNLENFFSYSNSCQFLKKKKISWASARETVLYNIPHQVQKLILILKVTSPALQMMSVFHTRKNQPAHHNMFTIFSVAPKGDDAEIALWAA